jgi:hypothetical protein
MVMEMKMEMQGEGEGRGGRREDKHNRVFLAFVKI